MNSRSTTIPMGQSRFGSGSKGTCRPRIRRSLGAALREVLQEQGINDCRTQFGKQLGEGLFEFRLRKAGLLLRVFCHACGNKMIEPPWV
jgi:hypothetical protein